MKFILLKSWQFIERRKVLRIVKVVYGLRQKLTLIFKSNKYHSATEFKDSDWCNYKKANMGIPSTP